jgi:hypothetical protein
MVRVMTTTLAIMMVIVGVPVLVIQGGQVWAGVLRMIRQAVPVKVHEVIQLDQGRAEGQEGDQSQCDDFHGFQVTERHSNSTGQNWQSQE